MSALVFLVSNPMSGLILFNSVLPAATTNFQSTAVIPPSAASRTEVLTTIIAHSVVPVLSHAFCARASVVFGHCRFNL